MSVFVWTYTSDLVVWVYRDIVSLFLLECKRSNQSTPFTLCQHILVKWSHAVGPMRQRLLPSLDCCSPFVSLLWEWCPWVGLYVPQLQVSLDVILELETRAPSPSVTRICLASLSGDILDKIKINLLFGNFTDRLYMYIHTKINNSIKYHINVQC